jgi:hypothetical protein
LAALATLVGHEENTGGPETGGLDRGNGRSPGGSRKDTASGECEAAGRKEHDQGRESQDGKGEARIHFQVFQGREQHRKGLSGLAVQRGTAVVAHEQQPGGERGADRSEDA